MSDNRRSFGEVLVAQWPGFLGLGLIAVGLFWDWFVSDHGGGISCQGVGLLIGGGLASLGYWSFANRNDRYNF